MIGSTSGRSRSIGGRRRPVRGPELDSQSPPTRLAVLVVERHLQLGAEKPGLIPDRREHLQPPESVEKILPSSRFRA